MVKDVIDGIKETELKAASLVEEARKKRAEIVSPFQRDLTICRQDFLEGGDHIQTRL